MRWMKEYRVRNAERRKYFGTLNWTENSAKSVWGLYR